LNSFSILKQFFFIRLPILVGLILSLIACQIPAPHMISGQEFIPFNAMPAQHRIMNSVRITWEVRQDVAHFCAFASQMGREQSSLTPLMGCAIWDILKGECTVVTGPVTSHVALGHELRHCFEGHFHR
jgi:hypothetical protein